MNLHTQRTLASEKRLLKRLTNLIEKGEPRKAISRTQTEWWQNLRLHVIKRIRTTKDEAMKNELVSSKYYCKKCGDPVIFSTNAEDAGAWRMNAPAALCLTGLNEEARKMVSELKCAKCFKGV